MLYIVHALLDGPMGFNAIAREVGGCNPTTLTQRLARLESLGLIEKLDASEAAAPHGNGRSCYRLTIAGRSLDGVIDAIRAWSLASLGPEAQARRPNSPRGLRRSSSSSS